MLLIQGASTNPFFNLAMEEHLLLHFSQEVIALWRNRKSVIIGRNQNALSEIDLDYVKARDIAVVRRLTGGGAVFHDLGNLNFTIIQQNTMDAFHNYAHFTAPVCRYLETLGVKAALSGRNDLTVERQKVSGNAQTVKNGRILHHGTLLFSADFGDLTGALKPREIKIQSKGVSSVRSRVANIADHLPAPMTIEAFAEGLARFLAAQMPDVSAYSLSPADTDAITALAEAKYSQWDWNFGQSPPFAMTRSMRFDFGIVDLHLSVENGTVTRVKIYGDFFGVDDIAVLEGCLAGIPHRPGDILARLESLSSPLGAYIHGMTPQQLADMFF